MYYNLFKIILHYLNHIFKIIKLYFLNYYYSFYVLRFFLNLELFLYYFYNFLSIHSKISLEYLYKNFRKIYNLLLIE